MAGKIILFAPHGVILDEKPANEDDILPGHLLIEESNGRVGKHPVAGGNVAPRMVAIDMPMVNKGVDDAYPENDQVPHFYPRPGEKAWMLLDAGENVASGKLLESAGNGNLQAHNEIYQVDADAGEAVVCRADEAIDNSAGSDPARIRVTFI